MSNKAFTAAALVSELIADNLEAELDALDAEDRTMVEDLITHLRKHQYLYAHNALMALENRTIH